MLANLFCGNYLENLHFPECNYNKILVSFKEERRSPVWCEEIIPLWQDCFKVSMGPARLWAAMKTSATSRRSRIFCDEIEEKARHPEGLLGLKGGILKTVRGGFRSQHHAHTHCPSRSGGEASPLRHLCVQFPGAGAATLPPRPGVVLWTGDATSIPMCQFLLMEKKKWAFFIVPYEKFLMFKELRKTLSPHEGLSWLPLKVH